MISVVIPTHNRKNTVKRAIDSVKNQTIKDIEIIVVSDGSSDGTNEMVLDMSCSDNRIKLISYPEAKGGNYARNTGIREATSEYIAFLDDDDEWLPDKLEKEQEVFKRNREVGLVYTGVTIIYENNGYSYKSLPKQHGDLSKSILMNNCITTTSSVMIRKSVVAKAGYFDTDLSALQDYDLWIRCCQIAKVGFVSEALVNYYINSNAGQITACTDKNQLAFEQMERKYNYLYNSLTKSENNQRLCNRYLGLAKYAFKNDEREMCRYYSKCAWEHKREFKVIFIFMASLIGVKRVLAIRHMIGNKKYGHNA